MHLTEKKSMGMILCDEHRNIIDADHQASVLYGYSLIEMLTLNMTDLAGPEVGTNSPTTLEIPDSPDFLLLERIHCRKDGSHFTAEMRMSHIDKDGKIVTKMIVREVSDIWQYQEELRRRADWKERLSRFSAKAQRMNARGTLRQGATPGMPEQTLATEAMLRFLARRDWMRSGETFLNALVKFINQLLDIKYVLVDQISEDRGIAETVANSAAGALVPNIRYALKGTPCETVKDEQAYCYKQGVQSLFPEDTLLAELGVESYAGVPLWDSTNTVIGIIIVMDTEPIKEEAWVVRLLQLAAPSAAAELEHQRNDRLLRAREQEFHSLAENIPYNIVRYDRNYRISYVNPRLARAMNVTDAYQIIGKVVSDVYPFKDGKYLTTLESVMQTGRNAEVEVEVSVPEGGDQYHMIRMVAEHDSDGLVKGVLCMGHDVTHLKVKEMLLQQRAEEFRVLVESSPDVIIRYDLECRRTYVNPAFERANDVAISEILGKTPIEKSGNIAPVAIQYQQILQQVIESATGTEIDLEWYDKNDRLNCHFARVVPEYDSEGKLKSILTHAYDISRRKQIEKDLTLASVVYQSISEGILVADANNRIISVNPAFTKVTGYSQSEVLGLTPALLKSGRQDSAFYTTMWSSLEKTGKWQGEISNRRKNGEIYTEWLTITTIFTKDGEV
ncbi:MAG TPA: PAS domain S-box protein, partial [Bacteroidota bacterium]|nr:PAS domain S-box protein [Bacteroidota bacterium]